MAKTFRSPDGQRIELERETKTLKLESINNSDYYKGKNHDAFRFTDGEGNTYIYDASLNADMTEYDSKIAKISHLKKERWLELLVILYRLHHILTATIFIILDS